MAALAQTLRDSALIAEIDALLAVKMRAGEAATSPHWPAIDQFIEAELALAQTWQPPAQALRPNEVLDRFLLDAVRAYSAPRRFANQFQ